jgi:thiol:disulfide interchange protein DsbC
MKPIHQLLAGLLVILASGLTPVVAEPAPSFAAIEQAVRQAMPSTSIDAIAPSPIPGLVEVVAGRNVFYADISGRWLVVGHLYDLTTARDVTAERKAQLARLDWKALPFDAAVHYGEGPLRLAVFSDPDCPWCRKLHQALRQAEGIEVWEIMFPVPALHPDARDKAVAILCDAQPADALMHAMDGTAKDSEPPAADCAERARELVDQAMAFGRAHGVQGTPALVAPDGRVHNGYLPIEQLRTWLEQGADGSTDGPGKAIPDAKAEREVAQ